MICAVVKGPLFHDAEEQIAHAAPYTDFFELRLDAFRFSLEEVKKLKDKCKTTIFTVREVSEGGFFQGSEEERLGFIWSSARMLPDYFDLEMTIPESFIARFKSEFPSIKVIRSYHNFRSAEIARPISFSDCSKIALTPDSSASALQLMREKSGIVIPMSKDFSFCRVMGKVLGHPWTYASAGSSGDHGQLSAQELADVYGFGQLTTGHSLYGLIGDPITFSPSHITHNYLMRTLDLKSVYVKIPVQKEALQSFLTEAKAIGFKGLSVTMPLKEAIVPFLDEAEGPFINTLVFKDGKILGYNTDGKGALDAIEERFFVKDKKIAILGYGGAAKAIGLEARDRGAEVCFFNRSEKEGAKPFSQMKANQDYDVLINATPVCPISQDAIREGSLVMDINTRELETEFLTMAKQKKCSVINAREMFINQAAYQFQLWFRLKDMMGVKRCLKQAFEQDSQDSVQDCRSQQ